MNLLECIFEELFCNVTLAIGVLKGEIELVVFFQHIITESFYVPETSDDIFVLLIFIDAQTSKDLIQMDSNKMMTYELFTMNDETHIIIWFGLCCLMTPGLSKDIRCHV